MYNGHALANRIATLIDQVRFSIRLICMIFNLARALIRSDEEGMNTPFLMLLLDKRVPEDEQVR